MKLRLIVFLCLFSLIGFLSGCVSHRQADQEALRELEELGIEKDDQKVKHPGLAGALNILPGFGNFYLASGTDESSQWPIGFLNLLSWPFSILWGIPEAAIDATAINEKETLYYYRYSPIGRAELARKAQDYQVIRRTPFPARHWHFEEPIELSPPEMNQRAATGR